MAPLRAVYKLSGINYQVNIETALKRQNTALKEHSIIRVLLIYQEM